MNPEITVELRTVSDQGPRKAKVTVTLDTSHGELTLSQLSIIHQEGKPPWVAYPDISFPDKEQSGKYVHLDIITPGRRLKKAIGDAVLANYRELAESNEPF